MNVCISFEFPAAKSESSCCSMSWPAFVVSAPDLGHFNMCLVIRKHIYPFCDRLYHNIVKNIYTYILIVIECAHLLFLPFNYFKCICIYIHIYIYYCGRMYTILFLLLNYFKCIVQYIKNIHIAV